MTGRSRDKAQDRRPSGKGAGVHEEVPPGAGFQAQSGWQTLQRSLGNQGTQRAVEREQQRAQNEGVTAVSGDTQARIDSLGARGAAMETPEASFHVGPEVDEVAHGLGARAFTQGRDVFLGSKGRDQATIAHELTHVSGGQTGAGSVQKAPEEPEEIEMPAMDIEREKAVAEALQSVSDMDAAEAADAQAENAADEQLQVSMQLPEPGGAPIYVKKPKKPAPAPHETLDPRTVAIIEGRLIENDVGQMVNPAGPINREERAQRAWDQAKWDEQERQRKQAATQARVQGARDSGKLPEKAPAFREGVAIDLISGSAPEAPFETTSSTGGEPEPSDFPTLKQDQPAEKPEAEPFVPQKFSFALTIDNIPKAYVDLTAEEAIAELKWRWIRVRDYIDVYKEWHRDILANREDHPVVGFVVDFLGRREPPDIRIWDELESDLGETMKTIDLDIPQLRSDFEAKERAREEREKREDEERIARGETGLLKFRGINPKWATRADWEAYMERHVRGAVQALQAAAHRVEARRRSVFRYKDATIQTTESAIKALEVAKKAGQIAASFLPVARGMTLLRGAIVGAGVSTAYNATQEFAQQGAEIAFSDRTEFDFAKIGKGALKDAVVGFVGGLTGGALGKYFGGALARRFGNRFSKEAIERLQVWLVEPATNVLTSPLTTTTRVVIERAMGDRKTITAGALIDEIVNGLPEDAIMGFAGSAVNRNIDAGSSWFDRPTQPNIAAPPPPAPEVAPLVPAGEAATLPQSGAETAGAVAPVAETAPAPRPAVETPSPATGADAANASPRTPAANPATAAADPAAARQPTAPVPQPTPVARQTPPPGGSGRRRRGSANEATTRDMRAVTEPTDAQLAVGDRRTTRRAVSPDAQPSRRTEPSEAELAVGDRRTTTRAVSPDAEPSSRRTEPSEAELAVGDQRSTTRAVDEGSRRQSGDEEPGVVRGPVEPGVRDLPPGSVHRELTYIEAYRSYNASVRQNPRFEAGIWRNKLTGEYVVIEGQREYVDPTQLTADPEFRMSNGQPVDPSTWHMVEHFHPGWGDRRQFFNRFASPEDYQVILASQMQRGASEPVRSQIRAKDPISGKDVITEYGYDPSNAAEPFYIRYKDASGATVEKRFPPDLPWAPNSKYRDFLNQQAAAEPQANFSPDNYQIPADESATGVWRAVGPPVADTSAPAPRTTLPMGGGDVTQRTTAVRPSPIDSGGVTQRTTAVRPPAGSPGEATQRWPAAGPTTARSGDTTLRMPAARPPTAGPADATQQMQTQQGPVDPYANTQDAPVAGGGSRPMPRGPVEVVPVDSVSDARILMQEWPGDRPMRLLANGEAKAAWNRDYGQPGDPPPAWMDPRAGLVVDTDQVPRPQARDTYHVPAEDPYVMFNVPTAQEALTIYRQNEAANAMNPANSARSFLLDHDTFIHVFQRGRGYSPTPPAAFVDQNGRLYVDVSVVDVTAPGGAASPGGPGGSAAPAGGNSQGSTQAMPGQQSLGGPPPMPQDAMRATQEMTPQAPVGEAPALPQTASNRGGDDTAVDENADTSVIASQGPARQPEGPGGPRRRDEKKTAPQGKVDPEAQAQRRVEGARYIAETGIRFLHATNRAIVRLNQMLKSEGIPWSADGGALWITADAGSPFINKNQVTPARTRQIYEHYGVPWDAQAARLANEPVVFEVDISRLPSPRDAGDIAADFAEGGNGRSKANADYTVKDLTGSPFDAMREISAGPVIPSQPPPRTPDGGEPVSVPGDEGRESTLPQASPPPQPQGPISVVAPSVGPGNGGPQPGGAPPPAAGRPSGLTGPDINPYSTLMPVQRIDSPVQAAQTYHRFLAMPERNRGRILALETAEFQDAWQRSPGFDMAPDRPPPIAYIDTHGNLIVDFDRANLEAGTAPSGPSRPAEDIAYPEPEARSYPRDTNGVYQEGVPRGVSREIHNVGEAQQIWTDQVYARRHVRFVRYEEAALVDLWQHGYGGQGDRPPLAWLDGQGFLVVDVNRVPFPEAVIEHERRTGPQ